VVARGRTDAPSKTPPGTGNQVGGARHGARVRAGASQRGGKRLRLRRRAGGSPERPATPPLGEPLGRRLLERVARLEGTPRRRARRLLRDGLLPTARLGGGGWGGRGRGQLVRRQALGPACSGGKQALSTTSDDASMEAPLRETGVNPGRRRAAWSALRKHAHWFHLDLAFYFFGPDHHSRCPTKVGSTRGFRTAWGYLALQTLPTWASSTVAVAQKGRQMELLAGGCYLHPETGR